MPLSLRIAAVPPDALSLQDDFGSDGGARTAGSTQCALGCTGQSLGSPGIQVHSVLFNGATLRQSSPTSQWRCTPSGGAPQCIVGTSRCLNDCTASPLGVHSGGISTEVAVCGPITDALEPCAWRVTVAQLLSGCEVMLQRLQRPLLAQSWLLPHLAISLAQMNATCNGAWMGTLDNVWSYCPAQREVPESADTVGVADAIGI